MARHLVWRRKDGRIDHDSDADLVCVDTSRRNKSRWRKEDLSLDFLKWCSTLGSTSLVSLDRAGTAECDGGDPF